MIWQAVVRIIEDEACIIIESLNAYHFKVNNWTGMDPSL